MGKGRRAVAGALSLAMLLLSMTAGAEDATPDEAVAAAEAASASNGSRAQEDGDLERLAELAMQAQQNQDDGALPADEQRETAPPAQRENEPPEQPEWTPSGEAWAELPDGTKIDGRLQGVLERALQSPGTTVYLLVPDRLEVKNLDIRELERVRLTVDRERFPGGASRYEVLLEEAGEKLIVQAVRIEQKVDEENPDGENPDGENPDGENPDGENPDGENPGGENPDGENPDGENPDGENPEGENPDGENPDGENPDGENPDGENPEGENPGGAGEAGEATPSEPQESTESPEITPAPTMSPEVTPSPTPSPTPKPEICLTVTAENYEPERWMTTAPTFHLSGIESGGAYVYGVFICNERLILLDEEADCYTPEDEGQVSLRFAVLDMMGDIVALSAQFDRLIDTQPPVGPMLLPVEWSTLAVSIWVEDMESGLEAISFDYGYTWEPYVQTAEGYTLTGRKGEIIDQRQIAVRDFAGNVSYNEEGFVFGESAGSGGGGGGGSGKQPVRHVKETMDYSTANYNALELRFPEEPVAELTAGGTTLALTLTGEQDGEPAQETFRARMTTWKQTGEDSGDTPNALVLEAQRSEGANVWSFSGDVYKLLYNSGVDYLVLRSGEYITALPTEGFTGGTQYGKLKAGGVSTRKFVYTLLQDEELRETTLSVTVEGETYLLEEDTAQPMYRYNVLVGPAELMNRPYESYCGEKSDADEIYEK